MNRRRRSKLLPANDSATVEMASARATALECIAVNFDGEAGSVDLGFDPDPATARLIVALSWYAAECYRLAYPHQTSEHAAGALRLLAASQSRCAATS